jgi:hypothetical protein
MVVGAATAGCFCGGAECCAPGWLSRRGGSGWLVAASAKKRREKAAEEGSGGRDGRGGGVESREGGHVGLRQGAGRKGRGGRKREKAARRWRWWGGMVRGRRAARVAPAACCVLCWLCRVARVLVLRSSAARRQVRVCVCAWLASHVRLGRRGSLLVVRPSGFRLEFQTGDSVSADAAMARVEPAPCFRRLVSPQE